MRILYTAILLIVCFASSAQVIPSDLIVSREPRPELKLTERGPFALSTLSNGTIQQIFATPPCVDGEYYIAIQLYYDLGDTQTEVNWTADLAISFLDNTTPLWSKTLSLANTTQSVPTPTQVFVSTAFHQDALSCDADYKVRVDTKTLSGTVPQSNVLLKFLFYKKEDYVNFPFVPATTGTLNCTPGTEKTALSWNYVGDAVIAYDVEWVYIAEHETTYTGNTAVQAFQFKEPARVTVAAAPYTHSVHYPDGKLWYRVRAVGYNPDFPEHRIPGAWFYGPDDGTTVENHQPDMTWQAQTIFAEHGKYKKIMTYYDETLRQRQQQTNLSTSGDTTLVGESLYDYEGRQSVTMMAVPAASVSLSYKPAFNAFATSADATVIANTSSTKKKFHYDNAALPNSTVATTSGAGKYYSSANDLVTFRRNYIPDAEGYVYSQQEYMNDGTGKVKRSSGVGKEFKMDGDHMAKYFYGQASKTELVRLFGSNVGDSAHYKKNLVIDNNGQASVSYLDQEGRVIATALAGEKPDNVAGLPSHDALDDEAIVENITDKNLLSGGSRVIAHKILNSDRNTLYTFNYDFSAKGADLSVFGCVDCTFDLKITITNPDGELLDINSPTPIAGNEATDGYSYLRKDLTVSDCMNPTTAVSIEFPVLLEDIGDYTVTKILTPGKKTYSQIKSIVEVHSSVVTKKTIIENAHVVDESDCDVCVSNCDDTDSLVNNTIDEIAALDCENKRQIIIQALRDQYPDSVDYQPTQMQIEAHPDYCDYELCIESQLSDAFEKQLGKSPDWTDALAKNYDDLANVSTSPYPDPFFRPGSLGASYTTELQDRLDDVFIGTMEFDSNNDDEPDGTADYSGPILDVINPLDPDFYVDEDGNATGTTSSGEHLLYLDVMRRYKDGYMSVTAYNNEILQLRWMYFKSFYLEAKRKTKLEITEFVNCPAAKTSLELIGTLPLTAGGVADYGDEHDATEPITEPELENYFASFKFTCTNKHLSVADSLSIINHLTAYFDGKPAGLFKFILTPDLSTDPHLDAIQSILNSYGCGQLSQFAETDPFSCAKDTTITYRNRFREPPGEEFFMRGGESGRMANDNERMKLDSIYRKLITKYDEEMYKVRKDSSGNMLDDRYKINELPKPPAFSFMKKNSGAPKSSRKQPVPSLNLVTTTPEYNALMAFYNATGGPNWTNNSGWGDPGAPEWYGVTQEDGHIIGLELPGNNLVGSLPSAIGDLTYLQFFDVTFNQLSGSLPSSMEDLTSLVHLSARTCNLSGPFPAAITGLTNLVSLDLANNQFSGSIPSTINGMTILGSIDLGHNQFSGNIPAEIWELDSLTSLNLESNDLTGTLSSDIDQLTNLVYLNLTDNQLSGSLPAEITSLVNLRYLYIGHNQFSGSLPSDFGSLTNLIHFYANANVFSGSLPSSIEDLTDLVFLNLNFNQFSGSIPSTINGMASLEMLDLSANSLTGTIPSSIGSMDNLVSLVLRANQLSGSIPSTLSGMNSLEGLDLGDNSLTGALPSLFGSFNALRYLDLRVNQLTGSLTEIASLTDLQYLDVHENQFSGSLPSNIGDLSELVIFRAHANALSGSLPSTTSDLTNLSQLNLSSNQFTGSLAEVASLINLTNLDVHDNQFSGSLPSNIGDLSELMFFYAQNNDLSGSLPSTIGDTKLRQLDLSNNQFSGPLPVSIGQLTNLLGLYLNINQFSGALPAEIGQLSKVETFNFSQNQFSDSLPREIGGMVKIKNFVGADNDLSGPIPSTVGSWTQLNYLSLAANDISGPLPTTIGEWTLATGINLYNNEITGPVPLTIGNLKQLEMLDLSNNQLSGTIPVEVGLLDSLEILYLQSNQLSGSIPYQLKGMVKLKYFVVHNNKLSGAIPVGMATLPDILTFAVSYNKFTFSGILPFKAEYIHSPVTFTYAPQDSVDRRRNITAIAGESRILTTSIDISTTPESTFQWFEFVDGVSDIPLNSESTGGHTVTLSDIQETENGKRYYYKIKNGDASALTLASRFRRLVIDTDTVKTVAVCVLPDTSNLTLKKFTFVVKWSEVVQQCLDSAAKENQILIDIAVEQLIDTIATSFLEEQTTDCLRGMSENFAYAYVPKEYHYTLYYYDQAGNLVQTVPPEGVDTTWTAAHKMITRYQYNSLNQVIWQKTPDAGESQFWYNDKAQIRLSQNAQQFIDEKYSYSKYDAQGRIIEVGELASNDIGELDDHLEELSFPTSPAYDLTDVTTTHYDFPDEAMEPTFAQNNVRNRIAWVEILEEGQAEAVATYYSYDIHGNVKSLLQHIPDLENKRTDYVYDLVSAKVNYVFYQYADSDQFIHNYTYDADNRLKEVRTSSDGYLWDTDATYRYYLHGPLARVELGHYRVQALDYYYTLQGWMKGVNMPFDGDPGRDGFSGINLRVGRDVFAYTIGYYEDDYKPANSLVTLADSRDELWDRYHTLMGGDNSGLFNGNISWMITDLKKIGQLNGARAKGMQAMIYQYDQLHRIVQSRGHTTYTPGSGFASRVSTPYDEDFSYDGNGNIMTLQRHDDTGTLTDDFTYQYYTGTNKLQYHDVVARDTTYTGAIADNNKVFDNITVTNTAYVPAGTDVTIRATTNIDFDPDPGFELQSGATFKAHIFGEEEGEYGYDAIGNLILDQDKGVSVSWTPFGKIHQVTKGDGVTTTFRYDASGNRIEKKTVIPGDGTTVTRYMLDAKGNVMAVYNDAIVTERSMYGISRIGMFRGSRGVGERRLEARNFELINHLGNVLGVVTDNIHMTADSTWANVIGSTDYYPFGLSMSSRTWADDSYRYGYNGKEKDNIEWGSTNYDYGFRIYNPAIGRFLSVDPLTKSFPMLTPYQFASNTPVSSIDLDGLEALITIKGTWWQSQITEALNNNDIETAAVFAFRAITTTLDNVESGSKPYAANDWKGDSPGTFNWSEANPDGLTVYFQGSKEPAFTIVELQPKPAPTPWYKDTFIEPIIEALTSDGGSSGGSSGGTGGGFMFFSSNEKTGMPIGHVRSGVADGWIDIDILMKVIGASGSAANSKNIPGSKNLKSIVEGLKQVFDAFQIGGDINGKAVELFNKNFGQKPAPVEWQDSCAFCHDVGEAFGESSLHYGPIIKVPIKEERVEKKPTDH